MNFISKAVKRSNVADVYSPYMYDMEDEKDKKENTET